MNDGVKTIHLPSPAAMCGYGEDTPVLLALSGGADSRLLLHLLRKMGTPLYALHVHHGIRGAEADRDEAFCRDLCARYGVPLTVCHVDAPRASRESGESLEEAARRLRYDCLASLMRERAIPLLVTAHHADDNLETVLLRLCRGTGLRGLGGIAPVRPFDAAACDAQTMPPVVVRPLLSYTKQDILDACDSLALDFVTDSTNADTSCDRNRVRAEVTPVLRCITDHPERQVLRACEALREDEAYLMSEASALLKEAACGDALSREVLASAHPSLSKRALRLWLEERTGELPDAQCVTSVLSLCNKGGTSHTLDVGGGYRVSADRRHLFVHTSERAATTAPRYAVELTEGELTQDGMTVRLVALDKTDAHATVTPNSTNDENVYNPFIRDTLTFDTILPYRGEPLLLRSREAGDTIYLRGKHRKLRKLQNEAGIPPAWRDRLPVLCDSEGILWTPVIGLRGGVDTAPPHRLTVTLDWQV